VPVIGKPVASVKAAVIAGLRSRILGLERHASRRDPSSQPDDAGAPSRRGVWELGCPSFDELLPRGLETNSLHEIKGAPSALGGASAGDWMAAIGFAARLAVRRLDALSGMRASGVPSRTAQPWVLWCWPKALAGEFGVPSAAGFTHLGLDPGSYKVLMLKSAQHFAGGFGHFAKLILRADTGGCCPHDPNHHSYSKLQRPLWPLDDSVKGRPLC